MESGVLPLWAGSALKLFKTLDENRSAMLC